MAKKKLTTNAGAPVADNQNTMTAGKRGLALLQDVWFLEKLGHFDREVIPERREQPDFAEPPLDLEGAVGHWNHREDSDYYTQPGLLFRLIKPALQKVLFENTARAMGDAPNEIKLRHIGNCYKADPAYGRGVAKALGLPLEETIKA